AADFEKAAEEVAAMIGRKPDRKEVISYLLYPKVYKDFVNFIERYADVSVLPTPLFYYGLEHNEETAIDIEPGKRLILKLTAISEPNEEGERTVFFELNGQPRE